MPSLLFPALIILLFLRLTAPASPCSDDLAYADLRNQVDALNHFFETACPLGEPIRCYASARRPDRRKVAIDRRVQHINAQVILREERPERIQSDINRVYREIGKVEARDCRKRAANARLWGQYP